MTLVEKFDPLEISIKYIPITKTEKKTIKTMIVIANFYYQHI